MADKETASVATNIEEAIAAVYAKVDYVQKKDSKQLGYSYAGEAAIIDVIRPEMVAQGITMRVVSIPEHSLDTYTTSRGSVMNQTTLRAVVRFTHAPSQTYANCEALGQGADTGDKSASKAMTAAFKYAIRQTFMLETGDDPDDTSSKDQEREQPANSQRNGGYMRANGTGTPLPPAQPDPVWFAEFTAKAKEAELAISDVAPVIGVRMTKDSWRGDVTRWLASDPAHSIDGLIAKALDMKAEVSDATV